MLPIGSVAALNEDADLDARARDPEPVTPRIGLVFGAATIFAAPFVILNSLVGVDWTDDQGTLMAGFRSLLDGHRMYDEIYSLYGPLYNLVSLLQNSMSATQFAFIRRCERPRLRPARAETA